MRFFSLSQREYSINAETFPILKQLTNLPFEFKVENIVEQYDPTHDRAPIRRASTYLLEMALQSLSQKPALYFLVKSELGSNEQSHIDWVTDNSLTADVVAQVKKEFLKLVRKNITLYSLQVNEEEARYFVQSYHPEQLALLDQMEKDKIFLIFNNKTSYCSLMNAPVERDSRYCEHTAIMDCSSAELLQQKTQRMHVTAWESAEALEAYQAHCEAVKQGDHRVVGAQLNLFHIDPTLAAGMPFWHEKGRQMYVTLEEYIRYKLVKFDYHEVSTPQVLDLSLWKRSGHYEKYRQNMFTVAEQSADPSKPIEEAYALKPMSCPGHIQIFNEEHRSYKDLPYRMSEFGHVHRNEEKGALSGLSRVRSLTQDDGHIFCTQEQIKSEVAKFAKEILEVYQEVGFGRDSVSVKVALRPEKRIGLDETWDKAEKALCEALDSNAMLYELLPGEGAFYGPKVEFHLKDLRGRSWQCGTIQLDYQLPEKLDAHFTNALGQSEHPVMLHRAMFGSIERFLSLVLEHYGVKLPVWLAPTQVVLVTVPQKDAAMSEKITQYAESVKQALQPYYRVVADFGDEDLLAAKVFNAKKTGAPFVIVIGKGEVAKQTLAVRDRTDQTTEMTLLEFFSKTLCDTSKAKNPEIFQGVLAVKKLKMATDMLLPQQTEYYDVDPLGGRPASVSFRDLAGDAKGKQPAANEECGETLDTLASPLEVIIRRKHQPK